MKTMNLAASRLGVLCALAMTSAFAAAATVSDTFDAGPTLAWGNESGNWSAAGGNYGAGAPANFPNAYTSLAYELTQFELAVDIAGISDGGVWVHSTHTGTGTIGVRGILLVTLGNSLYWHDVTNDSSYGASINVANAGAYSRLRVTVADNGAGFSYAAYVDGGASPVTQYASASFASGQAALYSNSAQRFDNFTLTGSDAEVPPVPLPAAAWLLAPGLAALGVRRKLQS
ncbi:MAG: VPLPA-CTERM sorting domain-containing protein [Gammaproteobacteria bacterium]